MRVRLLDLGTVPYLRSQTIFHGVAHAMEPGSPDTISFMSPDRPYLCVGFHQDLEKEIDLEYCRANDLPVLRREVGGGAVYLDRNQLFIHCIFHRDRLPRKVEDIYSLFIQAPVETYQALGIAARHRPVNDIVVSDRKIGGTGIAAIGDALVFAGSLMFDFNAAVMCRALRVSSEKMRDKLQQSLEDYMTTMRRELGHEPPRQQAKEILAARFAETLGVELEPGTLSGREQEIIAELDQRFVSEEWLWQKGQQVRRAITVGAGASVAEADYKAPGGLIRVTACLRDGAIVDLSLSGDFTFEPRQALLDLEAALRGLPLEQAPFEKAISAFYVRQGVQSPGVSPQDLATAIMRLQSE